MKEESCQRVSTVTDVCSGYRGEQTRDIKFVDEAPRWAVYNILPFILTSLNLKELW